MRLIDADRLEDTWDQSKTMIDNVEKQPTVAPVKHKRWIDEGKVYKCVECGWKSLQATRYCPNCGAVMDDTIGGTVMDEVTE